MARKHFCNIKGAKMDWKYYAPGEKSPETAFKQSLPTITIDEFHVANLQNFGRIAMHLGEHLAEDPKRDVLPDHGWTTASYRTSQALINHPESLPHIIQDLFNRKAMASKAYEEALIHAELPELKAHDDFYGISSPLKIFRDKEYTKMVKVARDLEANPATWYTQGGPWNPSIQQLQAAGMPADVARIARGMYDIEERRWPIMAQTTAMAGLPTPTRIPGRLPHVWQNPYKVIGVLNGTTPTGAHYMADYTTMKEAKAVFKALQARHTNMQWRIERPQTHQRTQADVLMALLDAKVAIRGPGFQKLIDAISDNVARGVIAASIDRSPIPVGGHLLDRVGETGVLALKRSQLKDAARIYETTGRTIYKWHATVKFITEVLGPMDRYGMLPENTNLRENALMYMRDLLGSPAIIGRQFNDNMRAALVRRGMNPDLAKNVANRALSGFNIYYLMFKANYYVSNAFQNFTIPANLLFKKAESSLAGEKSGSVALALAQGFLPTAANRAAKKWALDHGYVEPALGEGMAAGGVRDHLAMAIERYTRNSSMSVGDAYYRQFLSRDPALSAGGTFADEVAVNYKNRVGKPIIMTQLPDGAQWLGMFMTFPLHLMSTFSRGMRLMAQSVTEANAKAFFEAAGGMVALITACMALGGLIGLPFTSTWDDIINFLSQTYGTYVPDAHGMARELGNGLKKVADGPAGQLLSSVMQVGLLSTITQFNSSGSAAGPDMSMGAASAVAETAIMAFILLSRKIGNAAGIEAAGPAPTTQEWYDVTKTMPPQWAYKFEYAMKVENLPDVAKMLTGAMPDYAVGKSASGKADINSVNKDRARSVLESNMLFWFGSKSTQEADYDRSDRIFQQQQKAEQNYIDKAMKSITDPTTDGKERDRLIVDLMENHMKDLKPMFRSILDAEKSSSRDTDAERRFAETHSLPGMVKMDKWEEIHKQDNTARPADLFKK